MYRIGSIFLVSILFLTPFIDAQSTFGEILGVVKDQGGGSIPGAQVTVKGLEEGNEHSVVTHADGVFHFFNVKPGHYRLAVKVSGFSKSIASGIMEAYTDAENAQNAHSRAVETGS
jgi:hypothetical protein